MTKGQMRGMAQKELPGSPNLHVLLIIHCHHRAVHVQDQLASPFLIPKVIQGQEVCQHLLNP